MSIVKMSHMTVIGMAEDKSSVIDALMKLGLVELDTVQHVESEVSVEEIIKEQPVKPAENDWLAERFEDTAYQPSAEEQTYTASLDAMSRLELAIQRCNDILEQKNKSLEHATDAQLLDAGNREQKIMGRLIELEKNRLRLDEVMTRIAQLNSREDMLQPWTGINIDLAVRGTEQTKVYLGSIDTQDQLHELKSELNENSPEYHIEVLREDEAHILIALAVWQPRADTALSALRRIGFRQMPLQGEKGTAKELSKAAADQIKKLEFEKNKLEAEMQELAEAKRDFQLLHDFYLIRSDKYDAMGSVAGSRSTFWLSGWVPSVLVEKVQQKLNKDFMVAVDIRQSDKDEDHPILLKNPKPVKAYEVIVEMFSAPSVKDIDPAPLLAPFFFFFFGMMLSDVGYGLLLSGLCALLIWKVKAVGELGRMARMLFISGIGSILWGFMFGGFFGNMLTTLSDGKINMPALWFDPMSDPTRLMIWSMIFGVIHLFVGMGARIYILARAGMLKDGLLDIGPWFLIISGLGLMLGSIGGDIGMYLAIAGAAVLLLFGGRDAKNPVVRLFKGLVSIYNITSYFSDILSYTRILALVLATSVIAMVVNLLGFLLGPTPVGIIVFIIVALLGHTLNLALSALSAYVHTSRLQYVEFFSKFYEGGGRLWKPLRRKTKYIQLNENEVVTNN